MWSGGEEARELEVPERAGAVDRARGEELVLGLVGSHADSLLRVARRYSLCTDDAHDAYQRALEILLRNAGRLDPERAVGWLHTVVKHEALAINRSRRRLLGAGEVDFDALEARTSASPEERVLSSDRVTRSAEALHGLKPQEVRALWLKALGHSYEQICAVTGWSYTKVNRCLAEGRKSFLERYAGIESGRECERLAPLLSALVDGEASGAQVVELRRHLRGCLACRAAVRGLHEASTPLTVVLPAVALAAGEGAEHTSGLFVRVYETVTMQFHERAAHSLMRAQAIIDTVTAGKMAAAAASAAAMAGGGVAVEGAFHTPAEPAAIVRRADRAQVPASAAKQPTAAKHPRARSRTAAGSGPSSRSGSSARSHPSTRAASSTRSGSSTRHGSSTRARSPSGSAGGSAGGGGGSSAPAAAASAAGSGGGGSDAAAEFGFE
jgi:RNA polymerase sigma factor (sigma-70 family)